MSISFYVHAETALTCVDTTAPEGSTLDAHPTNNDSMQSSTERTADQDTASLHELLMHAVKASTTLDAHPINSSMQSGPERTAEHDTVNLKVTQPIKTEGHTADQDTVNLHQVTRDEHEQSVSTESLLPKELDLQLRQVFARGQDVEHAGLSTGTVPALIVGSVCYIC